MPEHGHSRVRVNARKRVAHTHFARWSWLYERVAGEASSASSD